MWKKIFDQLKTDSFSVYPPSVNRKTEEVPYIVIKNGAQIPAPGTNIVGKKIIDVIYYEKTYSNCEDFAATIKASLTGLEGVRRTGTETPVVYDEKIKAYTSSIEYIIQRRI